MTDNDIATKVQQLLSADRHEAIDAYDSGCATDLVVQRNANLGNLLITERAVHYTLVLYRMLMFAKEHELMPLHDDLYDAVKHAISSEENSPYPLEQFNSEIRQLVDWELVIEHIEKQKIRGYRDSRREKFRYELSLEAKEFLLWLERRLLADVMDAPVYSRNLLNDVRERLLGIDRELQRFVKEAEDSEPALHRAESCLYELSQSVNLTERISRHLTDLNARLIRFSVGVFDLDTAKGLLTELMDYESRYLSPIYTLRLEILETLEDLAADESRSGLEQCQSLIDSERARFRHLTGGSAGFQRPQGIVDNLIRFYANTGHLQDILLRVNDTVRRVYMTISSHIRELDRKGNRMADLKARLSELAEQPESFTADDFMQRLLKWSFYPHDPNFWNHYQKAEIKVPIRYGRTVRKQSDYVVPDKPAGDSRSWVTLEQHRLEQLRSWLQHQFETADIEEPLSSIIPEGFDDIEKVMEIAKFHHFDRQDKLKETGFASRAGDETAILRLDRASLRFRELYLKGRK